MWPESPLELYIIPELSDALSLTMRMESMYLALLWPGRRSLSVSALRPRSGCSLNGSLHPGTIGYAVPYVGEWLVRILEVMWFIYLGVSLVIAMMMEYTVRGRLRALSAITPADCLLVFVSLTVVVASPPNTSLKKRC